MLPIPILPITNWGGCASTRTAYAGVAALVAADGYGLRKAQTNKISENTSCMLTQMFGILFNDLSRKGRDPLEAGNLSPC